ncbi:hypothetical protein HMPREF0973_00624 [Prevotella veroralis F0319]|uniref:Uncharacterized protein n=1 Tax=Prevotella veroralis F0319 TaxID=649761 RepID=C9MLZ8_9BACT|nr:hypothetical protein HMPREF0973_00624 [Prevotella veroralis F0319]
MERSVNNAICRLVDRHKVEAEVLVWKPQPASPKGEEFLTEASWNGLFPIYMVP